MTTKEQLEDFFANPDEDNVYLKLWRDVVSDRYTNFPTIDTEGILCFGYPNPKYLEENLVKFGELRRKAREHLVGRAELARLMAEFLSGCHSDDGHRRTEFHFYDRLFRVAHVNDEETFPKQAFKIPYGVLFGFKRNPDGSYVMSTSNRDVDLDFVAELDISDTCGVVTSELSEGSHYRDVRQLVLTNEYEGTFGTTSVVVTFGGSEQDGSYQVSDEAELVELAREAIAEGYRGVLSGNSVYIYDDGYDIQNYIVHKVV